VRITDALTGEHGALVTLFDRLDRDLHAGAAAGEVREQAALLAAALVSHAHLEDELLFDRLGRAGGPPDPVVMARDHFALEERMVFPLAATLLGDAVLEELGVRWAERRGVWLDAGVAR
jgi:hypothetical protein